MLRLLLALSLCFGLSGCCFNCGGGEKEDAGGGGAEGDGGVTADEQTIIDTSAEGINDAVLFAQLARSVFYVTPQIDPQKTARETANAIAQQLAAQLGVPDAGVALDGGALKCGSISMNSTLLTVKLPATGCTFKNGVVISGDLYVRVTREGTTASVVIWADHAVLNGNELYGAATFDTLDGVFTMKGRLYSQGIYFFTRNLTMTWAPTATTLNGELYTQRSNHDFTMMFEKVSTRPGDCYPSSGDVWGQRIGTARNVFVTFDAQTPATAKVAVSIKPGSTNVTATLLGYGKCGGGGAVKRANPIELNPPWIGFAKPSNGQSLYADGTTEVVVSVGGGSGVRLFFEGEVLANDGTAPYQMFPNFAGTPDGIYEVFARTTLGERTIDTASLTAVVDHSPPQLLRYWPGPGTGVTAYVHERIGMQFSKPLAIDPIAFDAGSVTVNGVRMRPEQLQWNIGLTELLINTATAGPTTVQFDGKGYKGQSGIPLGVVSFGFDAGLWSRSLVGRTEPGMHAFGAGLAAEIRYAPEGDNAYVGFYQRDPRDGGVSVQVRRFGRGVTSLLPPLTATDPPTASPVGLAASYNSLALAFVVGDDAGSDVALRVFSEGAWKYAGLVGTNCNDGTVMVMDPGDAPVVATNNGKNAALNGTAEVRVTRFNQTTGQFTPMFVAPTDGGMMFGNGSTPALAVFSSVIFPQTSMLAVGWVESVAGGDRLRVSVADGFSDVKLMKWKPLADLGVKPKGRINAVSLALSNTALWAAWEEDDGFGPDVHVARARTVFGGVVNAWELIGPPLDVELTAPATRPRIAVLHNGTPIVTWHEVGLQGREVIHLARYINNREWELFALEPAAIGGAADPLSAPALEVMPHEVVDGGKERVVPMIAWTRGGEVELARLNQPGILNALTLELGAPAGTCQPLLNGQPQPTLSSTNCFQNLGAFPPVGNDLLPFELNSPLWSDRALKRRWLVLPLGASVGWADAGPFSWPTGTTLVKEFAFEQTPGVPASRRPVETRFLIKRDDAGWEGYSYQWNGAFTDAFLVDGGATERQVFTFTDGGSGHQQIYPSRAECARCHNAAAGFVLGPTAGQLYRNVDYGKVAAQQLWLWGERGVFGASQPSAIYADPPLLPSPVDTTQPLVARTRSYLAANCAQCHRPGGERPTRDFRWETPMASTGLCDGGVNGPAVVVGDAGASLLHGRMASRGVATQMPPLASDWVDATALAIIDEWINSLTTCQ